MRPILQLIPEIYSEALAQFQNKAFVIKMQTSAQSDEELSSDEEFTKKPKKKKEGNFDVMIHRQLMLKKQRLQEMRSESPFNFRAKPQ